MSVLLCANQFAIAINKDRKDRGLSYSVSNVVGLCNSFKWLSDRVGGVVIFQMVLN